MIVYDAIMPNSVVDRVLAFIITVSSHLLDERQLRRCPVLVGRRHVRLIRLIHSILLVVVYEPITWVISSSERLQIYRRDVEPAVV